MDDATWRLIAEDAGFARHGAWPEPGGTNDQTLSLREAFTLIWSEERVCRAALKAEAEAEDDG